MSEQFGRWAGNRFEQAFDQIGNTDTFGFRIESRNDSMPKHREREGIDIVERHVIPALQKRSRFRSKHDLLTRTRAGAPLDQLLHPRQGGLFARTNAANEV